MSDVAPGREPLRVLFVCRGNICRSPMAEALAQQRFGGKIRAESAGLTPVYDQATREAIEVMRERGLDISGHRSRAISQLSLDSYDLLVALTPAIRGGIPGTQATGPVVIWNVEDPFGGDLDRYRRCSLAIDQALERLELAPR